MDGDEIADAEDVCPLDPNDDADGDGICNNSDNCPSISNADQADDNANGKGDACDWQKGYSVNVVQDTDD